MYIVVIEKKGRKVEENIGGSSTPLGKMFSLTGKNWLHVKMYDILTYMYNLKKAILGGRDEIFQTISFVQVNKLNYMYMRYLT